MAGKPGRSGGARPGAGRKPTRELYSDAVDRAETRISRELQKCLDNLELLADGAEETEEEWQPAGLVTREEPLCYENGQPRFMSNGKACTVEALVFPDLPADQLVLVKRKVKQLGPSAVANIYRLDRILGKPITPAEEPELSPEELAAALDELNTTLAALFETDPKNQAAYEQAQKQVTAKMRELSGRLGG